MTIRICPFCGESIKAGALKCRFCCESLTSIADNTADDENELEPMDDAPHPVVSSPITEEESTPDPDSPKPMRQTKDQPKPLATEQPENAPETPKRLIKQNFLTVQRLSLVNIALPVLLLISLYYSWTNKNTSLSYIVNGISVFLLVATVISSEFLLQMLNIYMKNFEISKNFNRNILYLQIGLPIGIMGGVFYAIGLNTSAYHIILQSIGAICLLLSFVTYSLAGWCIYDLRQNDYVGGSRVLGGVMFWGIFFPPLWVSTPIFLYNVFSKASAYDKKTNIPTQRVSDIGDLLLKRQNYIKGIIACLLFMASPLPILYSGILAKDLDDKMYYTPWVFSFIGVFILYEYMLYMLCKYMLSFKISASFKRSMIGVMVSSAIAVVSYFSFSVRNHKDIGMYLIFIGLICILLIIIWICFSLAGSSIYKLYGDDFVGGSYPLSALMLVGFIFPPVWILVPPFIIYIFWRAKRYSDRFGFKKKQ